MATSCVIRNCGDLCRGIWVPWLWEPRAKEAEGDTFPSLPSTAAGVTFPVPQQITHAKYCKQRQAHFKLLKIHPAMEILKSDHFCLCGWWGCQPHCAEAPGRAV